jgi:polyphosphate glucokinase
VELLGIDIGGSGIKGAPVDLDRGELTAERHRLPTPSPARPEEVADAVAAVVEHFDVPGPVGCTFPGIVRDGVVGSAANVDPSWVGTDARALFSERTGRPFAVRNDADAAGSAEMAFGAGVGQDGVVLVLTFGTGIGSALFVGGTLVPNTELGHLELDGDDAERRAAAKVRDEGMSWKRWARRVDRYLQHVEALFSPDLLVVGGGVSRKADRFFPLLHTRAPLVPATLLNQAGIIGAAVAARPLHRPARNRASTKAKKKATTPARKTPARKTPARKRTRTSS